MSRHLIVGLGNPGSKYEGTRHNVGCAALERLARRHRISLAATKFDGRCETGLVDGEKVTLLKPETFMNRSGDSVGPAARYYDIAPEDIIVLHDDIDLELGRLKVKKGGGHGGHNGLRDVAQKLNSSDFLRVRLGIGRPEHGDVTNHVLGNFSSDERRVVDEMLEDASDAVETLLSEGLQAAQNQFH